MLTSAATMHEDSNMFMHSINTFTFYVGPLSTGSEGGRCCSCQWDGYPGRGALPLPPAGQLHRCPAVVSLIDYRIDYTIEYTRNMHNWVVWQLYSLLKRAWHNASAHNTRNS